METNNVEYQELVLKSTPVQLLYLQTSLQHRKTRNSSTCFTSRNYLVETYSALQEIRLQFQNRFTATIKGMYAHKENRQGTEKVHQGNAELSLQYRMLNRGTISLSTQYVVLKGTAGQNSTVSYFIQTVCLN